MPKKPTIQETPIADAVRSGRDMVNDYVKTVDGKGAISLASSAALVVALTSTIAAAFVISPVWVALGLSMVFAAAILQEWYKRFFQFFIIGLVIFHIARGGNMTLATTEAHIRDNVPPQTTSQFQIMDLLMPSSYAQDLSTNMNLLAMQQIGTINTNKTVFAPW